MTITTTRLYQILADQLNKETAESLTNFIKEDVKEEIEARTSVFLTKDDKVDILEKISDLKIDFFKFVDVKIERQTRLLLIAMGIGFAIIGLLLKN